MLKRIFLLLVVALILVCCSEGPAGRYMTPAETEEDNQEENQEPSDSATFKILFWNLQKGMFADQANDYEHFTAWVKQQDPDVCVFNEGGTQYYDDRLEDMPVDKRPLPSNWPALAKRYGHDTALWVSKKAESSGVQVLTSKYTAELVAKILDVDSNTQLATATGLFNVESPVGSIYFVASHLYATTGEEYDPIRLAEIKAIIRQTRKAAAYSSQQNWFMMGDFNTQSSVDDWYYNYGQASSSYVTVSQLLFETDYIDSWAAKHPGEFQYTASGSATRKDFVFVSPSIYSMCCSSEIVLDSFTTPIKNSPINKMYYPSDHLPIIVCLKYPKQI